MNCLQLKLILESFSRSSCIAITRASLLQDGANGSPENNLIATVMKCGTCPHVGERGRRIHRHPCGRTEPPSDYSGPGLFFASSRLQSRIGEHAICGLDAETTPFCFRHLSPSDLSENACDGNFNARKESRLVNRHLTFLKVHFTDVIPARDIP
jgi:hypothetical protein